MKWTDVTYDVVKGTKCLEIQCWRKHKSYQLEFQQEMHLYTSLLFYGLKEFKVQSVFCLQATVMIKDMLFMVVNIVI